MKCPSQEPYTFGFTAGGLGISYCQTLARLFLEMSDWGSVKEEALKRNVLQQSRRSSAERVEREFRNRVQLLTDEQVRLLAEGEQSTAQPLALLAAFKRYPVIFDFCVLTLMPKLTVFDHEVRPSDLDNFFAEVELTHPEIEEISDSTLAKIRQVMVRILAEGGILSGTGKPLIAQMPLPPEVARRIASDSPTLLRGFLLNDSEIAMYANEAL